MHPLIEICFPSVKQRHNISLYEKSHAIRIELRALILITATVRFPLYINHQLIYIFSLLLTFSTQTVDIEFS